MEGLFPHVVGMLLEGDPPTPQRVSLLWGTPELKEAALPKVMLFLQWLPLLQWPNPLALTGDT